MKPPFDVWKLSKGDILIAVGAGRCEYRILSIGGDNFTLQREGKDPRPCRREHLLNHFVGVKHGSESQSVEWASRAVPVG